MKPLKNRGKQNNKQYNHGYEIVKKGCNWLDIPI